MASEPEDRYRERHARGSAKRGGDMRLENIRCSEVSITPSDTSGVLVTIEVCDAEEAREQMLRGPDDAADVDWPLAKRYGEVCDRNRKLQEECLRADGMIDQLIEERDRANDALQATHIAMGGDGEWVAKAGAVCVAGETGDLAIDCPAWAEGLRAELGIARREIAELRHVIGQHREVREDTPAAEDPHVDTGAMLAEIFDEEASDD